MELKKATERDNENLKHYFEQQVVTGAYNYSLSRPHSFFDQYRLSTKDFHTYILRDHKQQIQATASILFKKAYINNQEQFVGYATDLRVSPTRKATLSWAKEFVPAFDQLKKERDCDFVFSDLELFENQAYNTLLRRRTRQHKLPRYHLFRKLFLVVIYGRRLLRAKPISTIKIHRGRLDQLDEIALYLQGKSVRRPLRYNLSSAELSRRCQQWPNFTIENFLIARNSQNQIIGCMAPWNNSEVQKITVRKYHRKSLQVFNTSRALHTLGLTRPLPSAGTAFKVKHLTHLATDNPDILYALTCYAYDECTSKELLVYPNYFGDFASRPDRSFISAKIPYGLYSILNAEQKRPDFLRPNPFHPAPDFTFTYF